MLPQYGFIHGVSHIAVREMARRRGAQFGDVESCGQVHLEKSALAKGHGQQVGGGFRSRPGLDLMQGRNGPLHDLSVTVAETGGCHIRRRVMAVQMRETLFYLSAAAMTVHVAKPAKVPENIEAHGGAGMKSAQRLVVASAMLHAQIDDFVPLRGAQRLHSLPDLTIGRMTGGVNPG